MTKSKRQASDETVVLSGKEFAKLATVVKALRELYDGNRSRTMPGSVSSKRLVAIKPMLEKCERLVRKFS
jgi:hypothetical protein